MQETQARIEFGNTIINKLNALSAEITTGAPNQNGDYEFQAVIEIPGSDDASGNPEPVTLVAVYYQDAATWSACQDASDLKWSVDHYFTT